MVSFKDDFSKIKDGKALDVGCRFGEFAVRIKEALPGCDVIGIDNDIKAVEGAKNKNLKDITFIHMDASNMQFADNEFSFVGISNTLHHIKDYDKVLSEMYRILKPGGLFVVNEMYSDNQSDAEMVHYKQHTWEAKLDMLKGSYQISTYTKKEIIDIYSKYNLKDVKYREFEEEEKYDLKLAEKTKTLLDTVEKIKDKPEYEIMKKEAKEIQELYKKYGIKRCKQLLIVGVK